MTMQPEEKLRGESAIVAQQVTDNAASFYEHDDEECLDHPCPACTEDFADIGDRLVDVDQER